MMNQKAAPNQFTRREERKILELAVRIRQIGLSEPRAPRLSRIGSPQINRGATSEVP